MNFIRKITVKPVIINSGRNVRTDGTCKVFIEVVYFNIDGSRKTKRISTVASVKPDDWDSKTGIVKNSDPEFLFKNDVIGRKLRMIQLEVTTYESGEKPEERTVISEFFGLGLKSLTDYIEDYINYRKSIRTPYGTLKEFRSCQNRLIRYETFRHQKLYFRDINMTFSDNFYAWMLSENFKLGTIGKTYTILKTILNYFYDRQDELKLNINGKFKAKSFKKGEQSVNEPKPLSDCELLTLRNHVFELEGQKRCQDRFLFQCATGMRYSDAFSITVSNIKGECIEYYPKKTVHKRINLVVVPMNHLSKSILQKYNYDMTQLYLTNQKYNQALKEMFELLMDKYPAIFKTTYCSHSARDTFISNCLNSGIDVPNLLKMVGQESYSVMKRYFKPSRELTIDKIQSISVYS